MSPSFPSFRSLFKETYQISFLFRRDILVVFTLGLILLTFSDVIEHSIKNTLLIKNGIKEIIFRNIFNIPNAIILWFLNMSVVRCLLTSSKGLSLIRITNSSYKSYVLMFSTAIACSVWTGLLETGDSDVVHLFGRGLGKPIFNGVMVIAFLICGMIWTRAFTVADVAWKADRSGFCLSDGWDAMRGKVWKFWLWGALCTLPIIIIQAVIETNYTFWHPFTDRFWLYTLENNISAIIFSVITQSFSLKFYKAIGF
ncbi:hypothetical protein [Gluconobacter thailandicus]|uniref:Uncharacterized protein n=1 Tax=Gluconobacter thailandicus TaxID=257438 RepID=A0AAP9EPY1_GLUTH|nr:hypothetical protein [Gluconobacter thailandicus]QEH95364.1 hypothetical protein FXF46_03170 [Gluconobacter thailandicus]